MTTQPAFTDMQSRLTSRVVNGHSEERSDSERAKSAWAVHEPAESDRSERHLVSDVSPCP